MKPPKLPIHLIVTADSAYYISFVRLVRLARLTRLILGAACIALFAAGCLETMPKKVRCLGQEPSWSVVVTESAMQYTTPEGKQEWKLVLAELQNTPNGTILVCTGLPPSGIPAKLTVRRERCNDTMSEKQFEYAATLELDGKTFRGCAEALK